MPHDEPSLFDLPLAPAEDAPDDPPARRGRPAPEAARDPETEAAEERPGEAPRRRPGGAGELPLFSGAGDAAGDERRTDRDDEPWSEAGAAAPGAAPTATPARAEPDAAPAPAPAGWTSRLVASLADGAFLGAVLVGGGLGATLLGVWPDADALLPLALFALVFSFVYSVVPLAFWGRTPGMAAAGLVARDADGGPLTFGQTGLRWLGGLLTLAAAGLPLLLALGPLGGRSLADRLSGSRTWAAPQR